MIEDRPGPGRVPLGHWERRFPADAPVARLSSVGYSFDGGASWALRDVSLGVGARERVCLMGANGSGKSTLALLLAGLRAPDEGIVELMGLPCFADGTPDGDAYRAARRQAGLVLQDPQDQIVTTVVADDVAFGPENLGLSPDAIGRRVERELDRVAARDLADADPTRLSGGQTQRVAIAGAMAMEPSLMVFDEATAFLDVRGAAALRRVTGRLDAVCAQVWVSHRAEDAEGADRLVVLDHGRVVYDGVPEGLLASGRKLEAWGLEPPFWATVADALRARGLELGTVTDESSLLDAVIHSTSQSSATGRRALEPATHSGNDWVERKESEIVWRAQDLGFAYDGKPVLSGVDLDVHRGERVALVGATGSGKTTLARMLAGLVAPTKGKLRGLGENLSSRKGRRRVSGRIGFVMQRPERQLFADTVAEDVAFGPRNLGLSEEEVRRRVDAALERLHIAHLADRSPFALSGGQQRLAALAGVLALEPEAWVLDEPLAGLDATARRAVERLLRELSDEGRAVVLVTHDMDQAARADHVLVLDHGEVALEGAPGDVFAQGERLGRIGLGLPRPLALARRLADRGLDLGSPLTTSALVESIVKLASESEAALGPDHPFAQRVAVAGPAAKPVDQRAAPVENPIRLDALEARRP